MRQIPRVLHIGNIANGAAELRDAMASRGLAECLVVETGNNRLQFAEDVRFSWDWLTSSIRRMERGMSLSILLTTLLREADILHVHHEGRIPFALQKLARLAGKPVVRHFHGVELRSGGAGAEAEYAEYVLVSTPDLLSHVPKQVPRDRLEWMPTPCPVPESCPSLPEEESVRIVHSYLPDATYRAAYGTEAIRRAVANLREKGHSVVLDEVSGVSHRDALDRYRKAHIAVDKLRIGWHGTFSVECAALGRAALAGIDPGLAHFNPPVIPVTEGTLESELESLVVDRELLLRKAREGYERARSLHGADVIAHRMASVYQKALG